MRKVYNARFQINGSGVKFIKKKKKTYDVRVSL